MATQIELPRRLPGRGYDPITNFRRWRERLGLRQRELSEAAHVSPGFLSEVERDLLRKPSQEAIARIRAALRAYENLLKKRGKLR